MDAFHTHITEQSKAALKRFNTEQAPQMQPGVLKDKELFAREVASVARMRPITGVLAAVCPHIDESEDPWMRSGRIAHLFQGTNVDVFLCDECVDLQEAKDDVRAAGPLSNCSACGGALREGELVTGFVWPIGPCLVHGKLCIACQFFHLGMTEELKKLLTEGNSNDR